MKVLVVEDAMDTARFMARALEEAGHEPQISHNGLDAEERNRHIFCQTASIFQMKQRGQQFGSG